MIFCDLGDLEIRSPQAMQPAAYRCQPLKNFKFKLKASPRGRIGSPKFCHSKLKHMGSAMLKWVVLAKRNAQLGNRLTMHAHLLAFCLEKGCVFLNPTFGEYADFFVGTRGRLLIQKDGALRIRPLPNWQAKMAYAAVRIMYQLAKVSRLVPWFPIQSGKATRNPQGKGLREFLEELETRGGRLAVVSTWKIRNYELCAKHAEAIRRLFLPVPRLRKTADHKLKTLRAKVDLILGVHIRHGDYRRHAGGALFFVPADYRRWMEEFAACFPGQKLGFAVCSDAKQGAEDFSGLEVVFGPGNDDADAYGNRRHDPVKSVIVEDNYMLSQCDYILGTVSTFCSWAAFWGNKPLLQVGSKCEHAIPERFVVPLGPD